MTLLAAGLAASVCGVIFGLPALRMRGLYFALITLMIAGAFQIIINAMSFPDGGPGLSGKVYAGVRQLMPHPPLAPTRRGLLSLCRRRRRDRLRADMLVERTRVGRAWALIRRSEPVAVAMGVNIVAYKVIAFAIAGFLAGVSGALMAGSIGQLDGRAFPASESIMMFALTVIGGAFHWSGPIFAGLLLRAVPGLLTDWHIDGNLAIMVFGAGLLHALITAPQGISGQVVGLGRLLSAKLSALDAARDGAEAVIEIRNLTVAFGGVRGLNDLSAVIGARITGLVGPNGAGKTTLLNAMSGFVKCQAGTVVVDGVRSAAARHEPARRAFGVRRTFQTEQVVENLTVLNNVAAALDNLPTGGRRARDLIAEALDYVGLGRKAERVGATLNASERRLVEIARCIIAKPRLVMMDEPGAGLSQTNPIICAM